MMKLKVQYPDRAEESKIIDRFSIKQTVGIVNEILTGEQILELRKRIENIYMDQSIKNYILDIVLKTREKSEYIACGASPRASINLIKAAKGRAFLKGRDYVVPDDIKAMIYDILRHRILLTYEAEAEDITSEKIIERILEQVNLP